MLITRMVRDVPGTNDKKLTHRFMGTVQAVAFIVIGLTLAADVPQAFVS
jgi:hypothetical protein